MGGWVGADRGRLGGLHQWMTGKRPAPQTPSRLTSPGRREGAWDGGCGGPGGGGGEEGSVGRGSCVGASGPGPVALARPRRPRRLPGTGEKGYDDRSEPAASEGRGARPRAIAAFTPACGGGGDAPRSLRRSLPHSAASSASVCCSLAASAWMSAEREGGEGEGE